MNKQELTTLLAKLKTELESGQPIDAGLRQSLQDLDRDIQQVLSQTDAAAQEPSLNERAQELESRFASEHPYLASTLRDVMDTLGKMGI
ncbi:MAG: DUF4404 family protein [Aquabacterium sp.]